MASKTRLAFLALGICMLCFSATSLAGMLSASLPTRDYYSIFETKLPPGEMHRASFGTYEPIVDAIANVSFLAPDPNSISVIFCETVISSAAFIAAGNATELAALGYSFDMHVLGFPAALNQRVHASLPFSGKMLHVHFIAGNYTDGTPNTAAVEIRVEARVYGKMTFDLWLSASAWSLICLVAGVIGGLVVIIAAFKMSGKD
jgi:hypothetical protein